MLEPLISVIVPIYNVEKYLNKCVDSIINQTYKNLEIILVDDGSPDKCPELCDIYAQKDKRIKVVHKENGGLSDARNAGMAVASGEYVSFIDSDDYIELNMLSDLYDCIVKDNSDVAACGVNWVDESCKVIRKDCVEQHCVLSNVEAMKELLHDNIIKQYVWNKLYKMSIIKDIPFEKGRYNEDVFWSYQMVGNANQISISPNVCYNYLQRSNSIMGVGYSAKRLDALDAYAERCEYIKEKYPDLYNLALYTYVGSCMYHLQCALQVNADKSIKDNIIDRIPAYKNGNIFEIVSGKKRLWLKMFCKMPVLTCKLRNLLGIGI